MKLFIGNFSTNLFHRVIEIDEIIVGKLARDGFLTFDTKKTKINIEAYLFDEENPYEYKKYGAKYLLNIPQPKTIYIKIFVPNDKSVLQEVPRSEGEKIIKTLTPPIFLSDYPKFLKEEEQV